MSRLTTDTTLLQTIIGSSFSMALRSSLTASVALVLMFISLVLRQESMGVRVRTQHAISPART